MAATQSEVTLAGLVAYLDKLREQGDVHFDERMRVWHVLGYQQAQQVQTDPVTFSSEITGREDFEGNFLRADDPRHRRLRGVANKAFTPKMVADLEPRIVELSTRLLDAADAAGDRWDFIDSVGHPLPFMVMAEMLGVPADDHAFIRKLSDAIIEVRRMDPGGSGEAPENGDGPALRELKPRHELDRYLLELIRARRKNPGDDLISRLLTIEADGDRLDEQETLGMLNVLVAGHHTTTAALGNTVLSLDENPHVWQRLLDDRSLIPAAFEESVRLRPPFPRSPRQTTKDTVLDGRRIPAGATVVVWAMTANRDDRVFADPNRFDLTRKPNPHLSFGKGIHHCIGAPVARLEAKAAFTLLLERYRKIRVREDAPADLRNPWATAGERPGEWGIGDMMIPGVVNKLPLEVEKH
ncbi:cytochrome P450 [Actinoplanes sp. NPDC000266]